MSSVAIAEDDDNDWEHIFSILEQVERRRSSAAQQQQHAHPASSNAQQQVATTTATVFGAPPQQQAQAQTTRDDGVAPQQQRSPCAAAPSKRPPLTSPSALRQSNVAARTEQIGGAGGGPRRAAWLSVPSSVNAASKQQLQQQQQQQIAQQQQPPVPPPQQQQQQQQQQPHKRRIPFSVLLQGPAADRKPPPPFQGGAGKQRGSTTAANGSNSSSSGGLNNSTAVTGATAPRQPAAGARAPPHAPPARAAGAGVGQLAAAEWEASLPAAHYAGRIVYARTAAAVEAACTELLQSRARAVGFDIEWRTNFTKGQTNGKAALVQLCYCARDGADAEPPPDGRGSVALLLHVFHSGLTPALRDVLRREDVALLGVNVGGDAGKLRADFKAHVAGCVDVGDVANGRVLARLPGVARCIAGPRRWSLAALSAEALRVRVPKPNHVRMGNWERAPLARDFCDYAALDAFLGLRLHWFLSALPRQVTASDMHMQALRARVAAAAAAAHGSASGSGSGSSDGGSSGKSDKGSGGKNDSGAAT